MKFLILFTSAFQDIKRNKKRTILTMLGIIIGIAAVITIVALGRGFEKYTMTQLTPKDQEGIEAQIYFNYSGGVMVSGNVDFFSPQDINHLNTIPGVIEVKAEAMSIFTGNAETKIMTRNGVETTTSEPVDETKGKIINGRGITQEDNALKKRVAVVDSSVVEDYFNGADPIEKSVKINNLNYTIIGVKEVFDSSNRENMFSIGGQSPIEVPSDTLNSYQKEKKAIQDITLLIRNGEDVGKIAEQATDYLNENGKFHGAGKYETFNLQDQIKQISQVLGTITIFIALVAGISLLIAGIGMMNMMYISVSERTREIGIRRALGATKREIQLQFMLEGLLITVIGGLIGYVFGILIANIISSALNFPVLFELQPILISIGVSISIGIFFSWSPAQAASRKNVIEIL